jgi:hypothetical protein
VRRVVGAAGALVVFSGGMLARFAARSSFSSVANSTTRS